MSKLIIDFLTDFHIAVKLFYDNKKSYLATFALFIVGIWLLIIPSMILTQILIKIESFPLFFLLIIAIVFFSIFFLLISYIRTSFGLAYDIMTSGELFTEFKRTFTYFKKSWLLFLLFTAPLGFIIFSEQLVGIVIILQYINFTEDYRLILIPIKIFTYIIDFCYYITFIEVFPSIIIKRNVKHSIDENFIILRSNFKRIVVSIGTFYMIFRGPMFVIDLVRLFFVSNLGNFLVFNLIFFATALIYATVGLPILSLIATRIYNTSNAKLII